MNSLRKQPYLLPILGVTQSLYSSGARLMHHIWWQYPYMAMTILLAIIYTIPYMERYNMLKIVISYVH